MQNAREGERQDDRIDDRTDSREEKDVPVRIKRKRNSHLRMPAMPNVRGEEGRQFPSPTFVRG